MQLCIFEDKKASNFLPLTYSRAVYDLICGYSSLKDKLFRLFPSLNHTLHCRTFLQNISAQTNPGVLINSIEDDECLFINGRILADNSFVKNISKKKKENIVFVSGDNVIAAFLSGPKLTSLKNNFKDCIDIENFDGIPIEEIETKTVNYIWDIINLNGKELTKDFENHFNKRKKKKQKISGKIFDGVHLVNKKEIIIEKGAVVKPGVVIDASNGPVFIDKNAEIFPNAVIEGPVYIGESTKIKSAATIYMNTSIGNVCKVGGEVEDSIMMSYSNKQHAGFIGHSYLGSWVNLGADTNNSDLKNNYSTVKAYVNGEMIDSRSQFLGLIIGDHSKSAINTMFNTGTSVGFSCNIFGSGFPDKFVPSFTWGGAEGSKVYDVEKCIKTAKIVMQRRNKFMSEDEENLFRKIFELTGKQRNNVVAI
ncbi:MAG TPA: GlmU family protein [Ignavibacteriaceae bacterium]|nr:GlmU family protein [Ignavibacteriaceae bacterium]